MWIGAPLAHLYLLIIYLFIYFPLFLHVILFMWYVLPTFAVMYVLCSVFALKLNKILIKKKKEIIKITIAGKTKRFYRVSMKGQEIWKKSAPLRCDIT